MHAAPSSRPTDALVSLTLREMQVRAHVCSQQAHEAGYRLRPRVVTDWNLIFVTRGAVTWVLDTVPHPLQPGRLLIVPPGIPHHATSDTARMTLLSLHVTAALPGGRDLFDLFVLPRTHTVAAGSPLDRVLRGALAEIDEHRSIQGRPHMLQPWCELVVRELVERLHAAGELATRTIDPLIAAVLDHLLQRLDDPPSLHALAQWAGYSPQHLNRVFRRSLGVTPLQYLLRIRLERAATLLQAGRMSVAGAGRAVGFQDPYYFSRVFSRHFGHSPSDHQRAAGSFSPG